MKFGLTQEEWNLININLVQPIIAQGATVYCYGSRARGDYKKFSDLDLMVEGSTTNTLNLPTLHEKIQNSNFPYKVDLVHYSEFADAYKPSYEKDKTLF